MDEHHPQRVHEPLTDDQQALANEYDARLLMLHALRVSLETKTKSALNDVPHIDRVSFRVKDRYSFARKSRPTDKEAPYANPLVEIEDQVAGRIVVFFTHDQEVVEKRVKEWFTGTVEITRKKPERATEFGYESDHYIFVIDEHLKPDGWCDADSMPTTFELQIRTLFMHAFAEPQHDLGYKGSDVAEEHQRMLAWVASSAWGADRMFQEAWESIARRAAQ